MTTNRQPHIAPKKVQQITGVQDSDMAQLGWQKKWTDTGPLLSGSKYFTILTWRESDVRKF
jgi:hypothetical protein